MSFTLVKSFDNRRETKAYRLLTINGRTWTRRCQWLEDANGRVKLKFDDGVSYEEFIMASEVDANTAWTRFKEGQSIQDSVSILGSSPPKFLQSKKQSQLPKGVQ